MTLTLDHLFYPDPTTSWLDVPEDAARCSGAAAPGLHSRGSAPASSSARTVRSRPAPAARDSAVSPAMRNVSGHAYAPHVLHMCSTACAVRYHGMLLPSSVI